MPGKSNLDVIKAKIDTESAKKIDKILDILGLNCSEKYLLDIINSWSTVPDYVNGILNSLSKNKYYPKELRAYLKKYCECTPRPRLIFQTNRIDKIRASAYANRVAKAELFDKGKTSCRVCWQGSLVDHKQIIHICETCLIENQEDLEKAKGFIEQIKSYHKNIGIWQAIQEVQQAYGQFRYNLRYKNSSGRAKDLVTVDDVIKRMEKEEQNKATEKEKKEKKEKLYVPAPKVWQQYTYHSDIGPLVDKYKTNAQIILDCEMSDCKGCLTLSDRNYKLAKEINDLIAKEEEERERCDVCDYTDCECCENCSEYPCQCCDNCGSYGCGTCNGCDMKSCECSCCGSCGDSSCGFCYRCRSRECECLCCQECNSYPCECCINCQQCECACCSSCQQYPCECCEECSQFPCECCVWCETSPCECKRRREKDNG